MPRTRYVLTDDLIRSICDRIKAGAYEHVAAEAEGIPRHIFADWLGRTDNRKYPRKIYRRLKDQVMQAKAHARFMCESNARMNHPKFWLLHGGGRENPLDPGWSRAGVSQPQELTPDKIIAHPDIVRFVSIVRGVLQRHPQAFEDLTAELKKECPLLPAKAPKPALPIAG